MNKQQIQEMINWDAVPEKFTYAYVSKKGDDIHFWTSDQNYMGESFEEVKRPIKLIDGAWYAFSYDNPSTDAKSIKMIGKYFENINVVVCQTIRYKPDQLGVTIHKQIPDDFWS